MSVKRDRRDRRWLLTGIVLVLLFAVGYIIWSSVLLRERQLKVAELVLERNQQMLHVRLDGMMQQREQDLMEECTALDARAMTDTVFLRERWSSLFASTASLVAIRLADENGDMVVAKRSRTDIAMQVLKSTKDELPEGVTDAIERTAVEIEADRNGLAEGDPRTEVWYTKALEDSYGSPVWHLTQQEGSERPLVQVAFLVRSSLPAAPYRIMMFELDLGRSSWVDTRSSPLHTMGIVIHDGDGAALNMPDALKRPSILAAEQIAVQHWTSTRTTKPFTVQADGERFMALTAPYLLNGTTVLATVLVDLDLVAIWTEPEKRGLVIASILLMMLIVLLSMSWLNRRREVARIRRQMALSETQELKLAKALGEREVLNREVHHRVKNNLQVVSSLLNLQVSRMEDDAVRNEFLRGKRRIDIIALVHHELYGLKDLRNVDLQLFFDGLYKAIRSMHVPNSERVSMDLRTDELKVDQDTAIELGIILCELLGNAFQHAFPYATGGHIDIHVQPVEGDLYRMVMKDNGKGLSDNYSEGHEKLGLEIVDALSEQLDGAFHIRSNAGTICEVLFRMRHEHRLSALNRS